MRYPSLVLILFAALGCSDTAAPSPPELPAVERLQRSFDLIEQDIRQAWRDGEKVEIWMTTFGDSIPRFTVRTIRKGS